MTRREPVHTPVAPVVGGSGDLGSSCHVLSFGEYEAPSASWPLLPSPPHTIISSVVGIHTATWAARPAMGASAMGSQLSREGSQTAPSANVGKPPQTIRLALVQTTEASGRWLRGAAEIV